MVTNGMDDDEVAPFAISFSKLRNKSRRKNGQKFRCCLFTSVEICSIDKSVFIIYEYAFQSDKYK